MTRWASALAIIIAVSGCTTAVDPQEAPELATLFPAHIFPGTRAGAFTAAFADHCLDHIEALSALPAHLAAADYIEISSDAGFRAFVTDSRKPFVAFRDGARADHCLIAARARTGQRAAVDRMVAARYPGARPIDPAASDLPAERAWLISATPPTMIYTQSRERDFHPPRLILGIIRQ